jgi:OST-HTH/LOTUS domain
MGWIDIARANKFLQDTVAQEYDRRRGAGIPGAELKELLNRHAKETGDLFDEKQLGFKSFLDFVSQCPQVTAHRRQAGDFLVTPLGAEVPIKGQNVDGVRPRIRRDLWFAFLSFPEPGTNRYYDPVDDRVLYRKNDEPAGNLVLIPPCSKEQQLEWHKAFAANVLGEVGEQLRRVLEGGNVFHDFSVIVRRQPDLYSSWNAFRLSKIRPIIEEWATRHGIPEYRWLVKPGLREPIGSRAEIYEILDKIPIEKLLDLPIPLRWLVEATRRGKERS